VKNIFFVSLCGKNNFSKRKKVSVKSLSHAKKRNDFLVLQKTEILIFPARMDSFRRVFVCCQRNFSVVRVSRNILCHPKIV